MTLLPPGTRLPFQSELVIISLTNGASFAVCRVLELLRRHLLRDNE